MVDLEVRRQGGGFNRKRRYRGVSTYVDSYDGSWGLWIKAEDEAGERHRPRRRYEEPLSASVRRQLVTIAESAVRRAEDDVAKVAKTICENHEDEGVKNEFQELVLQLIVEQPFKIPFVAAVVLLVNVEKPELASLVFNKAGEMAQSYIAAGQWREVKLVLRFFACLQGIFEGDGVFPILEELFSRAVDLQTASSEDSLGLELVKIILYTMAYVMASSASGFESHASALLEKTDIIASTPHTLEALVDPFPSEEKEGERLNALSLFQKQLQDEASNSWELACLPRPWKMPPKEDSEEDPLKAATKHVFPTITVPNPVKNGPRAIFPEIYLSVYADQNIETIPPTTNIASSLLRDALVDTISILDYNRIAAARFLIDVDCYFAPSTFIKRATPFDKLRDMAPDKPTWKPEDVAIDAVFSQLLQLPSPEHKLVYYHSILTEACKIAPAAIAPSLGRAIRFLYRNVDKLDLSLAYRFLDWFSHHLSNFGFTWKWTEWVDDVELPAVHPKKSFIVGALDKEIRLSFAQRIKGTLPEPYQALISENKEKDTPDFKYAQDITPYSKEGQEMLQLIRKKASDEEIALVIGRIEEQAKAHGLEDPSIPSTDAFVTSICCVGSKSLSHFLSCIERCKDRLLKIGPRSAAARRQIITSVMEYWVDQPGNAVNIIDKLLNYTILTPLSVIEWALVDNLSSGSILAKPHVFEMIAATMGKVTNRIRQIVAARTQPGLVEPQLSVIQDTLTREKADMQAMFQLIEDSVAPVAAGTNDAMMERADDSALVPENELIRDWGKRWLRVFSRKAAVEEAFIAEAMVEAVPEGTMAVQQPVQVQTAGAEPDGMADIV
ncbi:Nuclear cap-binding protein subunit 1 [Emydomyces testavorans]|uniref:Nuclear cap-binding protein subunit 1 n=1 Tax=Emydomyces testavorans TaxID=2070801 RepID=A0AAF0DQ67_9EURO|nr:Nuclear cap-binding protein subunit 1 [Emydomyces testavorans]